MRVYDIRKHVGKVGTFLSSEDKKMLQDGTATLGIPLAYTSAIETPVIFNGKTRRGGLMQCRLNPIGPQSGAMCARPIKMELHPALFDEAHPERMTTARHVLLHELAHYITFARYGRVSAHGNEWKRVMRLLGETPSRCHSLDYITSTRKQNKYMCQTCNEVLSYGRRLKNDGANHVHTACKWRAPAFGHLSPVV